MSSRGKTRGNLGRLLLKKLGRVPQRPKRKTVSEQKPTRRVRASSGPLGKMLTLPREKRAATRELVVTAPGLLPPTQPTQQLQQAQQIPQSGPLSTQDLIRPGEKLKQSIEGFLLDQRSPHTRKAYGKDLKRFVQYLLMRNFQGGATEINRTVIIGYKDLLLGEGLEHTTVDRHLATLRSFFQWLVDDGILAKSPADGVRFLKPKKVSKTIGFTDEEVVRILKTPDLHTRSGAMHYAILMTLFYCGLRRSELCELRTTALGEERGQKVFRLRGKGNRERVIVLVPAVWNALKHYFIITRKSWILDGYVFSPIRNNRTGVKEKPIDPSLVFYIVRKYAKAAGIANRVSPHSCRATAISNARDHHAPDRAIQEFAGWASPDMITRYDKRRTSVDNSAAKAISYGAGDRVEATQPEKPVKEPIATELS